MAYAINIFNKNNAIQIDGTLVNSRVVASGTLAGTTVPYGQTFTITYPNNGFIPEIYVSVTMNAQAAGLIASYWTVDSIDLTTCVMRRSGSTTILAQEQLTYLVLVRDTGPAPSGYGVSIYSNSGTLVYATNRGVQAFITATATIATPRGSGSGAPSLSVNIDIPTSYSGLQYFFVNPIRLGNFLNQDSSYYTIRMYRNSTYQYQVSLVSGNFSVSGGTNVSQQLVFPCVTVV